jgi:uncharacterized membrane protein
VGVDTHRNTRDRAHIHECILTYIFAYIRTYIDTHIRARTHTHMLRTYVRTYIYKVLGTLAQVLSVLAFFPKMKLILSNHQSVCLSSCL